MQMRRKGGRKVSSCHKDRQRQALTWDISAYLPAVTPALFNPAFKHGVHDGLVSPAFSPEPGHNIGVYAQRHDNFRLRKHQLGVLEEVIVQGRDVGSVNLAVGHGIEALPVS